MRKVAVLAFAALAALAPALARAQSTLADTGAGSGDAMNSGDNAWVLVCTALVLLLVLPGLTLFYGGQVRARNFLSVGMQAGAIMAAVSVLWIAAGYTLAFGDTGSGWIGGGDTWMLNHTLNILHGDSEVSERTFALYQMAVAVIAPVLMIGAWAGRARFGWAVSFAALWSVVVYAPVAHWLWSENGWLAARLGTVDYAGGIVVFTSAGVSALVAALLLGKRHGDGRERVTAHSPALALVGAGLLWLGWFGLTGGTALTADDNASTALINTQLSASVAALLWLAAEKLRTGKTTAAGFAAGAMAGLAAISPAAMVVSPGAALVIGAAAALVSLLAVRLIRDKLKIDDSLDVFAVFGAAGMTGSLLLAAFLSPSLGGVGYNDGVTMLQQLVAQAIGVGAVVLYSAIATAVLAVLVSLVVPMRVSEDDERDGLDLAGHGTRAWEFD